MRWPTAKRNICACGNARGAYSRGYPSRNHKVDHHRLLEPIGDIAPAEAEAPYCHHPVESAGHAGLTQTNQPPRNPGTVQFFMLEEPASTKMLARRFPCVAFRNEQD
jgi:hypothetical protein